MVHGRVIEAALAMDGELISGPADARWQGASLDSRTISGGELFFALRGKQVDGHQFVDAALERGASAVVVRRGTPVPNGGGAIEVDDTYSALHRLTRAVREHVPQKLVSMTGSMPARRPPKSSSRRCWRDVPRRASPGNLNNLYGFPSRLLGMPTTPSGWWRRWGCRRPASWPRSAGWADPTWSVFTNVGAGAPRVLRTRARDRGGEGRASRRTVAAWNRGGQRRRPGGCAYRAPLDGRVGLVRHRSRAEFGAAASSRWRAGWARGFELAAGRRDRIDLPLHGRYNVENFLAAAACALVGSSADRSRPRRLGARLRPCAASFTAGTLDR